MVRREQRKEVGSVDQRASYRRCERMQSVVKDGSLEHQRDRAAHVGDQQDITEGREET